MRFATQPAPLGTVNAVLSASDHVGDAPYGVGNADDIYGRDGLRPARPRTCAPGPDTNALVGYRLADAVDRLLAGHPRHLPGGADDGTLLGVDERRQVTRHPRGRLRGRRRARARRRSRRDARVSMNLWGFTPAFHKTLQAAMDAAVDASEEAEVLLPEVVAQSLATSPFVVLPAVGRCIGVTHPDDLSLVQAELNRQVAAGERPAGLWTSLPLSPAPSLSQNPAERLAVGPMARSGAAIVGVAATGVTGTWGAATGRTRARTRRNPE